MINRESLAEWAKDKPLSILQLDPADRAVLRIAGEHTKYYDDKLYIRLLGIWVLGCQEYNRLLLVRKYIGVFRKKIIFE